MQGFNVPFIIYSRSWLHDLIWEFYIIFSHFLWSSKKYMGILSVLQFEIKIYFLTIIWLNRYFLNISHNDRERQRKANLIIDMKGNSTYIKNPEDLKAEPRSFAFDYSYWSHDEFKESSSGYLEPTGSRYADQVMFILL